LIIDVMRYGYRNKSTAGLLLIDNVFEGFTLEDGFNRQKIAGQTRIPKGFYNIKLRTEGGMHASYSDKYPWHQGMLHLQDVPDFTWIYFHIGNFVSDTAGCILVGDSASNKEEDFKIFNSTEAYQRFYLKVLFTLNKGEEVYARITDLKGV